jgi:hypothetical protein
VGGWVKLATHTMPVRDLILSFSAPAALICLLIIFLHRKMYREFSSFFIYIVYTLSATVLILLGGPPLVRFVVYWIAEALSAVLALLVLREVFHRVFALPYAAYGWFRFLLPGTVAIIVGVSLWETLTRPLGSGYLPRIASAIYWFDLGVHALEGTILLLVLALTIVFPVTWRRYEFGILAGFGISACVSMLADLLLLEWGHSHEMFFRYGPPIAYFLATLVWLHAFFRPPQPSRRSQMEPQELLEVVRRSRELLEKIEKALGLRRRVISPTV